MERKGRPRFPGPYNPEIYAAALFRLFPLPPMIIHRKGVSELEPIRQTARLLAERFSPKRLILFSRKTDLGGETASFKLCMVANLQDKRAAQREIFLQSEGMPPFDVLIYTPREWAQALSRAGSFAQRIEQTGCDLIAKA